MLSFVGLGHHSGQQAGQQSLFFLLDFGSWTFSIRPGSGAILDNLLCNFFRAASFPSKCAWTSRFAMSPPLRYSCSLSFDNIFFCFWSKYLPSPAHMPNTTNIVIW